jgi:hypothetical protein
LGQIQPSPFAQPSNRHRSRATVPAFDFTPSIFDEISARCQNLGTSDHKLPDASPLMALSPVRWAEAKAQAMECAGRVLVEDALQGSTVHLEGVVGPRRCGRTARRPAGCAPSAPCRPTSGPRAARAKPGRSFWADGEGRDAPRDAGADGLTDIHPTKEGGLYISVPSNHFFAALYHDEQLRRHAADLVPEVRAGRTTLGRSGSRWLLADDQADQIRRPGSPAQQMSAAAMGSMDRCCRQRHMGIRTPLAGVRE